MNDLRYWRSKWSLCRQMIDERLILYESNWTTVMNQSWQRRGPVKNLMTKFCCKLWFTRPWRWLYTIHCKTSIQTCAPFMLKDLVDSGWQWPHNTCCGSLTNITIIIHHRHFLHTHEIPWIFDDSVWEINNQLWSKEAIDLIQRILCLHLNPSHHGLGQHSRVATKLTYLERQKLLKRCWVRCARSSKFTAAMSNWKLRYWKAIDVGNSSLMI